MGAYDALIGTPISGQPTSSGGFGIPVRNAILDLDTRVSVREAAEALPVPVRATSAVNTNTIVSAANVWGNLPTSLSVTFTNPSTDFDLVCMVYIGALMKVTAGGGNVRMGINITGGVTKNPDPGTNAPAGFGLMPFTGNLVDQSCMGFFILTIPAGAAMLTLTCQGLRSVVNTCQVNYPVIEIVPHHYE